MTPIIPSSVPLQIDPVAYQALLHPAQRADDRTANQSYYSGVEVYNNVAIVPLQGTLGLTRGWPVDTPLLGAREQLANCATDDAIDTVVLHIHSPGGYCQGEQEVIAQIGALRAQGKNVVAFAAGDCLSLAYNIACAADLLVGTPTSRWGSISGVHYLTDSSESYAQMGIKVVGHKTGDKKAIGYPGLPITESDLAEIKARLLPTAQDFTDHVTARRSLAPEHMQGQIWRAKDAPAGLIDTQANSLDDLLASLLTA